MRLFKIVIVLIALVSVVNAAISPVIAKDDPFAVGSVQLITDVAISAEDLPESLGPVALTLLRYAVYMEDNHPQKAFVYEVEIPDEATIQSSDVKAAFAGLNWVSSVTAYTGKPIVLSDESVWFPSRYLFHPCSVEAVSDTQLDMDSEPFKRYGELDLVKVEETPYDDKFFYQFTTTCASDTALLLLALSEHESVLTANLLSIPLPTEWEDPSANPDVIPDVLLVRFVEGTTYEQMTERLANVLKKMFPEEDDADIRDRLDVYKPKDDGIQWTTLCRVQIEEERCFEAYLLLTAIEGVESVERDYWAYPNPIFGDMNDDGSLDVIDYIILKKALLSPDEPDAKAKHIGDVNRDGNMDSIDYILLKKNILSREAIG